MSMTYYVLIEGILEADVEEAIEAMMEEPEFADIDAFMAYKLDDDDLSYDFMELQALARNMTQKKTRREVSAASVSDVETVKRILSDEMGFNYVSRTPVKQVRGVTSPLNGTNRFANTGAGGTGFGGGGWGAGGFTSFGGGPGAMGSGKAWDAADPSNLGMGSRKKR